MALAAPPKKLSAIEQFKLLVSQLADFEQKYQSGTCPYCLKKRVYLAELPCKHSFCANCCKKLVKVTKISKALG